MTYEARREYLEAIRDRYQKSTKKKKTLILDEFCKNCDYSRKYATRILNGSIEPRKRKPGPKPRYLDILIHLKELWEVLDKPCSKKLKVAIPELLGYYTHKSMTKEKEKKLKVVSAATIDRLLRRYKDTNRRGLSGTKPLALIRAEIPLELLHKEVKDPGYVEVDSVHHCGDSLKGIYASTLTVTDIASTWTVNKAFWGRGGEGVIARLTEIESELPFPLTKYASDNGSEVLNHDIKDYLKNRKRPVKSLRRRANKKNDNAHVEQKNFTHVRQIFGYDRLDDQAMVAIMNEIYTAYWNVLHNFFTPTMKLVERKRVGGKIRKKYDEPKTPFTRIIENDNVPKWVKGRLKEQKKGYNPFTLRKLLEERMTQFLKLVENASIRRKFRTSAIGD